MTTIIYGHDAIEYATRYGVELCKHADPTEPARSGLSESEAREIAAEDPRLVYCEAEALVAVVATDGIRPVVWGLADNEEGALADARDQDGWDDAAHHQTVQLTTEQALRVREGVIGAEDLGLIVRPGRDVGEWTIDGDSRGLT